MTTALRVRPTPAAFAPTASWLALLLLTACNGTSGDGGGDTDADDTETAGTTDTDGGDSDATPGPTCGDHASAVGGACACDAGYTEGADGCVDVDECGTGTASCDPNATCANTDGSYTCTCNVGTHGDGATCAADWEHLATLDALETSWFLYVGAVGSRIFVSDTSFDGAPHVVSIDGTTGAVATEGSPSPTPNDFCSCGYTARIVGAGASLYEFGNYGSRYDTVGRTWSAVTYPHDVWHGEAGVVALDGFVYLIGGRTGTNGARVDRYDTTTDHWDVPPALPVELSWAAAAAIDGVVYALGDDNANPGTYALASYAPGDTAWTQRPSTPAGDSRPDMVAYAGNLWVFNRVEYRRYDPASQTWTGPFPVPFSGTPVGTGTGMYLVGAPSGTVEVHRFTGP